MCPRLHAQRQRRKRRADGEEDLERTKRRLLESKLKRYALGDETAIKSARRTQKPDMFELPPKSSPQGAARKGGGGGVSGSGSSNVAGTPSSAAGAGVRLVDATQSDADIAMGLTMLVESSDEDEDGHGASYVSLANVDVQSDTFAQLPFELQHEIILDLQEAEKHKSRRGTIINKTSEEGFSEDQITGLVRKNLLNRKLEHVRRALMSVDAGNGMTAHKIVSEANTLYILEKQPIPDEPPHDHEQGSEHHTSGVDSHTKLGPAQAAVTPLTAAALQKLEERRLGVRGMQGGKEVGGWANGVGTGAHSYGESDESLSFGASDKSTHDVSAMSVSSGVCVSGGQAGKRPLAHANQDKNDLALAQRLQAQEYGQGVVGDADGVVSVSASHRKEGTKTIASAQAATNSTLTSGTVVHEDTARTPIEQQKNTSHLPPGQKHTPHREHTEVTAEHTMEDSSLSGAAAGVKLRGNDPRSTGRAADHDQNNAADEDNASMSSSDSEPEPELQRGAELVGRGDLQQHCEAGMRTGTAAVVQMTHEAVSLHNDSLVGSTRAPAKPAVATPSELQVMRSAVPPVPSENGAKGNPGKLDAATASAEAKHPRQVEQVVVESSDDSDDELVSVHGSPTTTEPLESANSTGISAPMMNIQQGPAGAMGEQEDPADGQAFTIEESHEHGARATMIEEQEQEARDTQAMVEAQEAEYAHELLAAKEATEANDVARPLISDRVNEGALATEAGRNAAVNILESEERSLHVTGRRAAAAAAGVSSEIMTDVQTLLRLFGLPFITAPMEAEAQCASLEEEGHTQGTITDDSDIFLFGAKVVYRRVCSRTKGPELYQRNELQSLLGLDRPRLIRLAYLLGSDYTKGVTNIGIVKAMEIMANFPGEDMLKDFKSWIDSPDHEDTSTEMKKLARSLKHGKRPIALPTTFPDERVEVAYTKPLVERSSQAFHWGTPDVDAIREYADSKVCPELCLWGSARAHIGDLELC